MTRIPGDLDRPDRFLLGLTARQLLLVAPAFAVIAILAWVLTPLVPIWTLMPVLAVLAGGAIAMTMIKQDGMSPDQLAGHVVRYLRSPRHLVSAPEGTPPMPRRLRGLRPRMRLGHFREPWRGFRGGDIDLGDSCVRLLAVSSLDLQLRSEKETRVLTEGFGRLLNALDDSLCVIVRGEPIDLEEAAEEAEHAGQGPDGAANAAVHAYGADHAAFLRSMAGGLRRQVYIVVRGADGPQLDARCEEILTLLVPFGIRATRLDGRASVQLLARSTGGDVPETAQAAPGDPVRGGADAKPS
jgi:hypothetical protein